MIQQFIEHFTYAGLFLTLFAAGLGLPIPEEVAIIAGGVLPHEHVVHWWIALPVCILGVLVDAAAAIVSVPIGFGIAFLFTDQLERVMRDVHRVERWLVLYALAGLAAWLAYLAWRQGRRT